VARRPFAWTIPEFFPALDFSCDNQIGQVIIIGGAILRVNPASETFNICFNWFRMILDTGQNTPGNVNSIFHKASFLREK
jgi:hypothetical protein